MPRLIDLTQMHIIILMGFIGVPARILGVRKV